MVLNLLNINSLIFAQFTKIHRMTILLEDLKPHVNGNMSSLFQDSPVFIENGYVIPEGLEILYENRTDVCYGRKVKCSNCYNMISTAEPYLLAENLEDMKKNYTNTTRYSDNLMHYEYDNDTVNGINITVITDYDYSQDDNTTDTFHLLDDSVIDFQRGYHLPFKDETNTIMNDINVTSSPYSTLDTNDVMTEINKENNESFETNENLLKSSTNHQIEESTTGGVELDYISTSKLYSQESSKSFEDTMPTTNYITNDILPDSEVPSSKDSYKTCFMEYRCYRRKGAEVNYMKKIMMPPENKTEDYFYYDDNHHLLYSLSPPTKQRLSKLCWETMFGQELVRLTTTDLVFTILGILFFDFFRALFVRFMNGCWCWDLEKKFPEYGDFKIAENILHLINNQGIIWMGMFFSPGIVIINTVKLVVLMYLRSWAVMTCNVPHEVVFKASKSNNFYLALLLTMLFLCVLPVGYALVWVKPSWHCGPFSKFERIYKIITNYLDHILPKNLKAVVEYITSPGIVIPLLVLLIFIIYYLTSLTYSLKEALQDLKFQLRRERTEERRKVFQIADRRRRAGSLSLDNTPFSKWKMALPHLIRHKSSDSDDKKEGGQNTNKSTKKQRGDIFAKIVEMAKARNVMTTAESKKPSPTALLDDETDTEFHESLPDDINQFKDTKTVKPIDIPAKNDIQKENNREKNVIFTKGNEKLAKKDQSNIKKEILRKMREGSALRARVKHEVEIPRNTPKKFSFSESEQTESTESFESRKPSSNKKVDVESNRSDSIGSVIPVITISKIESDEDLLDKKYINVVLQPSSRTSKAGQFRDSIEIEESPKDKNYEQIDNNQKEMLSENIKKTDTDESGASSSGQLQLSKLKIVGSIPKTKEAEESK